MTVSSRTPEGESNDCPVCGRRIMVEPSRPSGDAPCPHCGMLLWFEPVRQRFKPSSRKWNSSSDEAALPVGTGVIAFNPDADSGATQGYLGRVVRLLPSSVYEFRRQADRWAYRVHIPALGGLRDFAASFLIQTQGADFPLALGERLQFDLELQDDMGIVFGAYLLSGGEWAYFVFRKSTVRCAFYRLGHSLTDVAVPRCLWYEMPRREVLNRDYVQRAVEEVFGT